MQNTIKITPVILAGGSGTRLWPVSRSEMPKQFCKIIGEVSLFQKTLQRVSNRKVFNEPIIISNDQHRAIIKSQMDEIACQAKAIILEPTGRDTAPAIAIAACLFDDTDEDIMLVMPSDHIMDEQEAFENLIMQSSNAAAYGKSIITFGIKPTHPDTGYGYIRAGEKRGLLNVHDLDIFIEKPELSLAEELIQDPDIYWNAGIFMFNRSLVCEELKNLSPDLFLQIKTSICHGKWSGKTFSPGKWLFEAIKPISFDYAIMEKTERATVAKADMHWTDMGSWHAVWDYNDRDEDNNSLVGPSHCVGVQNSLVMSDGPTVAVSGLQDIVVIAQEDAVLVTSRNQTQNLKSLVAKMKSENDAISQKPGHKTKSWGDIKEMDKDTRNAVSKITINPHQEVAGQDFTPGHKTWLITSGHPVLVASSSIRRLSPNQFRTIDAGEKFCLINPDDEYVEIIEILHSEAPRTEDTHSFQYHPNIYKNIFDKTAAEVA